MMRSKALGASVLVYMLLALTFLFTMMLILLQTLTVEQIANRDQIDIRQANFLAESGIQWGIWALENGEIQAEDFSHQVELAAEQTFQVQAHVNTDGLIEMRAEGWAPRARSWRTMHGLFLKDKVLPEGAASLFFNTQAREMSLQQVLAKQDPEKPGLLVLAPGQTLAWPLGEQRLRRFFIMGSQDASPPVTIDGRCTVVEGLVIDGPLHVTGRLSCDRLILKGPLTFSDSGRLECEELILAKEHLPTEELLEAHVDARSLSHEPPEKKSRFYALAYRSA